MALRISPSPDWFDDIEPLASTNPATVNGFNASFPITIYKRFWHNHADQELYLSVLDCSRERMTQHQDPREAGPVVRQTTEKTDVAGSTARLCGGLVLVDPLTCASSQGD